MAVLYPGKAYVNARRLLVDVVKSNQQLRMIVPIGSEVFVDATQGFDSIDKKISLSSSLKNGLRFLFDSVT